MSSARRKPALKETKALLRALGSVLERAEDMGEDELADVLAVFKTNIARRASLQQECERVRSQVRRRFRCGGRAASRLLAGRRRQLARRTLYLVDDEPPKE